MELRITNFRGCREATLPLNGLTLVAGHNGQGKTSIAQAVSAVLCGQWQPAGLELKKKEAEALVIDGERKAVITAITDTGSAKLVYPSCEYSTDGEPPYSRPILTGQLNLVNMTTQQRVLHLLEATGMTPTIADLRAALPDMGQENVQRLWKKIEETSWDDVCKVYRDQATASKAEWRIITGGETWGASKANGWQPAELSNGDAIQPESVFRDESLQLRKQARDADIANSRIGLEREGDKEKAANVTALEKQLIEIEAIILNASKKFNEAVEEEKKAEKWVSTGWECPHCQGKLAIDQGNSGAPAKVRKADDLTPEQIEERNLKFSQIQQKKVTMRAAHDDAVQKKTPIQYAYKEAKDALKRISETQEGVKIDTAELIAKAEKANKTADLIKQYHAATEANKKVERALHIAAYLEADGEKSIRQSKVAKSLEAFNALLAENCRIAGYKTVSIDSDLVINYDGRRYEFLSASEQYRVRVILQVSESNPDDLPLIFDAIDILDNAGRNGLIKLLRSKVKNALLTATILKREEAPDLSKVGGKTLWLENGVVA